MDLIFGYVTKFTYVQVQVQVLQYDNFLSPTSHAMNLFGFLKNFKFHYFRYE